MNYTDLCKVEIIKDSIKRLVISDEEYFSDVYKDYISNSRLKLINPKEGGSPELYLKGLTSGYNSSLEFGSAVHSIILQPESYFICNYTSKPNGKLGYFIERVCYYRKLKYTIENAILRASSDADYYKGSFTRTRLRNALKTGLKYYLDLYYNRFNSVEGKERIILSSSMYWEVLQCLNEYSRSLLYSELHSTNITDTKIHNNEEAILLNLKVILHDSSVVILPFKLKIDNYSVDDDYDIITLNDLKTTSHDVQYFMGAKRFNEETNKLEGFLGSFQKFHYCRQLAAYLLVLQALYGEKYKYKVNILAITSKYPYNTRVCPISNAYIQKGLVEFKDLICRVAFYTKFGFNTFLNYDRV